MKVQLLGQARARLEPQSYPLALDKRGALLAYLAYANDWVLRDQLAFLFWPDSEDAKAKSNLRQLLKRTKELPYSTTLETDADRLRWHVECDVMAFNQATEKQEWVKAVELYQGHLLENFAPQDSEGFLAWLELERSHLQLAWQEAALNCAEALAQTDRHHEAATLLRQVWELDNFDETILQAYMRHAYRGGHREAALRLYDTFKGQLAREMEIEPLAETIALAEAITNNQLLTQTLEPKRSKILLQQLEPLVGRERDLKELAMMLEQPECRFLVMTGLGGVGKTRLVLEFLRQNIANYQHGGYFVPLAGITSPDLIIPAIAQALSFTFFGSKDPKEQLTNYLREKQLLLVTDNLEHVLEGAEVLLELLEAAPKLKLLITSRHKPDLPEVWSFALAGLPYNATDELSDAGQLFIQAAKRTQPRFSPTAEDLNAIQTLGELVEGLPLALELAAAWVRDLNCQEILNEIQSNLDFLRREGKSQHGSMRATFEHSWNLLSPEQQRVLAKLSVFRGGFTRQAAQQVAGATPYILLSLLNRSLLRKDSSGRFDLHELVRQYSDEKLATDAQRNEEVADSHANYFANFLQMRETELLESTKQIELLADMTSELDNVRRAWEHMLEQGMWASLDKSLRSVGFYFYIKGLTLEGERLFSQTVQVAEAQKSSNLSKEHVLGRALERQGWFCRWLGKNELAETLLLRALAILETHQDPDAIVDGLNSLGAVYASLGRFQESRRYYEKSVGLAQGSNYRSNLANALNGLGNLCRATGDLPGAIAYYQHGLNVIAHHGSEQIKAVLFSNLGVVLWETGEHEDAERVTEGSLELSEKLGDLPSVAICTANLAEFAFVRGKYERTQVLRHKSLSLRRRLGDREGEAFDIVMLGYDACRLEQLLEARRYFLEGLTLARAISATPIVLDILVGIAELEAKEGYSERAFLLLSFVLDHPATHGEVKGRAKELIVTLASPLAANVRATVQERAISLTLDDVVEDFLS